MGMDFLDMRRFNQRFWRTAVCRFWVGGNCKRGPDCTFAHGQRELQIENSESVPAHIKAVRAEQDRFHEERRQEWRAKQLIQDAKRGRTQSGSRSAGAKRARHAEDGSSVSESSEENGAQTDSIVKKYLHEEGTETAKTSAGSASASASGSTSAPVPGIWALRPPRPAGRPAKRPEARQPPQAEALKLPADAEAEELLEDAKAEAHKPPAAAAAGEVMASGPPRAEKSKVAAKKAEEEDAAREAKEPTRVVVVGFSTLLGIYLGGKDRARSRSWLDAHQIHNLVKCLPEYNSRHALPQPAKTATGCRYLRSEVTLGLAWQDLWDIEAYFSHVKRIFMVLSLRPGNTLFWCTRGHHRSAAALSMYMLFLFPHEQTNSVMAEVSRRRAKVEFGEEAGKYPPLAKVVRLWHQWLTTGQVPLEAAHYLRWPAQLS